MWKLKTDLVHHLRIDVVFGLGPVDVQVGQAEDIEALARGVQSTPRHGSIPVCVELQEGVAAVLRLVHGVGKDVNISDPLHELQVNVKINKVCHFINLNRS